MKKIATAILFLTLFGTLTFLFTSTSKVENKPTLTTFDPHMYEDPKKPIKKIHITVFYFIPKDALGAKKEDWKIFTENNLRDLLRFHTIVFLDTSSITYSFSLTPITGEMTKDGYGVHLGEDNPDALRVIKEEMTKRVFTEGGDLYTQKPKPSGDDTKDVYLIVYEGDGGAANGDFALISRSYLTDKAYTGYSSTLLAHEFYHTLGLPDLYQESTYVYSDGQEKTISLIKEKDIMGRVDIPLFESYLSKESLIKMGL